MLLWRNSTEPTKTHFDYEATYSQRKKNTKYTHNKVYARPKGHKIFCRQLRWFTLLYNIHLVTSVITWWQLTTSIPLQSIETIFHWERIPMSRLLLLLSWISITTSNASNIEHPQMDNQELDESHGGHHIQLEGANVYNSSKDIFRIFFTNVSINNEHAISLQLTACHYRMLPRRDHGRSIHPVSTTSRDWGPSWDEVSFVI